MRLRGNTSGYVQIQPSAAAGSWTMTLPSSAGSNGQFLTTNGSGVTTWTNGSSGGTISGLTTSGVAFANSSTSVATNASGFYWDSTNGRLGIGTNAPSRIFHVKAPEASETALFEERCDGCDSYINIYNASPASTGDYASIRFTMGAPGDLFAEINAAATSTSSADLLFSPGSGGATTERMRITSTGRVGIGTNAPTGILTVNGGTASSTNGTDITLAAQNGNGTNKNGGNITLTPGSPTGTGTTGGVRVTQGAITAAYASDTDLDIDFSKANIITTSASCAAVTLNNMQDGGSYSLIVTGSTSGTCTFSHTGVTTFKFAPANGATDTSSSGETVYTFLKVGATVYVSWVTGMR